MRGAVGMVQSAVVRVRICGALKLMWPELMRARLRNGRQSRADGLRRWRRRSITFLSLHGSGLHWFPPWNLARMWPRCVTRKATPRCQTIAGQLLPRRTFTTFAGSTRIARDVGALSGRFGTIAVRGLGAGSPMVEQTIAALLRCPSCGAPLAGLQGLRCTEHYLRLRERRLSERSAGRPP